MSDAQRRVAAASHIDKLWDDMNADTAVSKKAADMTAKVRWSYWRLDQCTTYGTDDLFVAAAAWWLDKEDEKFEHPTEEEESRCA